jgi:hypothetical protein
MGRELERKLTAIVIAGSFSGFLAKGAARGRGGASGGTEASEGLTNVDIDLDLTSMLVRRRW